MLKTIIKLCFITFVLCPNLSLGQKIEFKKLQKPLSHSTVYDITKDKDGLMWFATREGLNSYNSYSVKTYYNSTDKDSLATSLKSNEISCLLATNKGLYVGTSLGLNKYNKTYDNFSFIDLGDNKNNEPIKILYQSSDRNIFVGTQNNLYLIDPSEKVKKVKSNVFIKSICEYKPNVYMIALSKQILLMNNSGHTLKKYTIQSLTEENLNYSDLTLFRDSLGKIWLGTPKGLFYFDVITDQFKQLPIALNSMIESNIIRKISEDKEHNLWLGTGSGIFIYNPRTNELKHYGQSYNDNLNQLSDKSIYSLYYDNLGIMWVGTYFGGVNYTKPKGIGFLKLLPGQGTISGKVISKIIQDRQGKLWIGTEDSGITIFDIKNNTFQYIDHKNGLSSNNIHDLYEDSKGNIWIGTFLGGLNKYDINNHKIEVFKTQNQSQSSLSNDYVYSIIEDSNKKIWVGTQAGLNIYDETTKSFSLFKPNILGDKFIYDLIIDKNGAIWICTRFSGIFKYTSSTDKLDHYFFDKKGTIPFYSKQFISAFEDSKNRIWFGSLDGGLLLYDENKKQFSSITKKDGLPNNNIYGAIEDNNGLIWITSNKGLSQYNPSKKTVVNFNKELGLITNQFNFKSLFKDNKGVLYFGSINGLNYFNPDSLSFNITNPKIKLISFKLFNKEVPVSQNGILTQNIDLSKEITLKHSDNVITFEYTTLNFELNSNNNYEYYLEGFEEGWNKVGNKHTATYTNLSPGNYTFRVRTNSNLNKTNERSIKLTITPPFWKSNWAYVLYTLLVILSILLYTRVVGIMHKQKLAVQLERVEKEKISELSQHKLNFFTFISHEFKTPLTLIIASIERHFQNKTHTTEHSEDLTSIKKSATKLHHLVQQLMEFRKIETDHAELELKKGDVILFIKNNFEVFLPLFKKKEINHKVKSSFSEYICFFDVDKMDTILTNLISNAVKNTKEGGYIELTSNISNLLDKERRSYLTISLKDTGVGMSDKIINRILDPFFYDDHRSNDKEGSGIGLALVNSLTNYLGGSIKINSKEGEGTTIEVTIPLFLKHPTDSKQIEVYAPSKSPKIDIDNLIIETNIETLEEISDEKLSNQLRVLLVEDNLELLKFLQKHFSLKYKVSTASNGLEALSKIEKIIPDVIISDVKMSQMNGLTFCKKVKSDPKTSHIPFLLLTGQTEESQRLEGLGLGANAYINKPFNIKELDLLVKNLLISGRNLENRFSNQSIDTEIISISNNQEREFKKTIEEMVQENYTDPNFTIETMAHKIGISRSLLHIKMKKTMNTSASDYLKSIRLKTAINLLKQGFSISEVAYKTGYNDPNYFSRMFKKETGLSPSNFLDIKKNID